MKRYDCQRRTVSELLEKKWSGKMEMTTKSAISRQYRRGTSPRATLPSEKCGQWIREFTVRLLSFLRVVGALVCDRSIDRVMEVKV
jgi:hypothetical protein